MPSQHGGLQAQARARTQMQAGEVVAACEGLVALRAPPALQLVVAPAAEVLPWGEVVLVLALARQPVLAPAVEVLPRGKVVLVLRQLVLAPAVELLAGGAIALVRLLVLPRQVVTAAADETVAAVLAESAQAYSESRRWPQLVGSAVAPVVALQAPLMAPAPRRQRLIQGGTSATTIG